MMLKIAGLVVLSIAAADTGWVQHPDENARYIKKATIAHGKFTDVTLSCRMFFYNLTEDVTISLNKSCARTAQDIVFTENKYNTTINIECQNLPDFKSMLLMGQISMNNCSPAVYSEKLGFSTEDPPLFDGIEFRTDTLLLAANHSTDKFTFAPRFCEIDVTTEIVLENFLGNHKIGLNCTKDMLPCFEKRELFKQNHVYCAGQSPSLVFNVNANTTEGARQMIAKEFNSYASSPVYKVKELEDEEVHCWQCESTDDDHCRDPFVSGNLNFSKCPAGTKSCKKTSLALKARVDHEIVTSSDVTYFRDCSESDYNECFEYDAPESFMRVCYCQDKHGAPCNSAPPLLLTALVYLYLSL